MTVETRITDAKFEEWRLWWQERVQTYGEKFMRDQGQRLIDNVRILKDSSTLPKQSDQ